MHCVNCCTALPSLLCDGKQACQPASQHDSSRVHTLNPSHVQGCKGPVRGSSGTAAISLDCHGQPWSRAGAQWIATATVKGWGCCGCGSGCVLCAGVLCYKDKALSWLCKARGARKHAKQVSRQIGVLCVLCAVCWRGVCVLQGPSRRVW